MIVYAENPKDSEKRKRIKILEVISKHSNIIGYKVNIKKPTVFPCQNKLLEFHILNEKKPFTTPPPPKKGLKYKTNKLQGYTEKQKLMEEIKDLNKGKDSPYSSLKTIQYC